MGSTEGFSDEAPVHQVNFTQDFWMGNTEVTQAQYDDVMDEAFAEYFTPTWRETYGVGDDYPAYELEWGDAVLYCNALSVREGFDTVYTYSTINGSPGGLCGLSDVQTDFTKNGYRLPTEAEWEFACRGNTDKDFYWGKDFDPYPASASDSAEIGEYAVWSANSWSFGIDDNDNYGNHPVASKLPNSYGLYDMSGNVYEWINDWFEDYTSAAVVDPTGGENTWHFVRGGCWGNSPTYLRCTNRTFDCPGYYYAYVGFRVVRSVQ
ncbi:formylglycine-generating enzyme family protein [bacterium]|nr:formylglycine-generating enzyme family protein [bacterium]